MSPSAGALGEITCVGEPATIVGTEGPDLLEGTEESDVIVALGGDDDIRPGAGDLVCAGEGDDRIEGDGEHISAHGERGNDFIAMSVPTVVDPYETISYLTGGEGDDVIHGTDGRDELSAGPGSDVMRGFGGTDRLWNASPFLGGTEGDSDLFDGGLGPDSFEGGSGGDTFLGGPGSDSFFGGSGDDVVLGGDGDDRLSWGGQGSIDLAGGSGTDKLYVFGSGVSIDLIEGTASSQTGGGSVDGLEVIFGTRGADHLIGDDGTNVLWGDVGDDKIEGGGGDDLLIGGLDTLCSDVIPYPEDDGSDELFGGSGNDRVFGGNMGCYGDDQADLLSGGPGEDQLYGLAGDDVLRGDDDDDFLNGGSGDDDVDAGPGEDRCVDLDTSSACELALPPTPCSDGFDNDSDGSIDLATDSGCRSLDDDYEGLPWVFDGEYLYLEYRVPRNRFVGAYRHPEQRCVPDRVIVVKRERSGRRDLVLGTTTSKGDGKWVLSSDARAGRYYATARPSTFRTPGGELVTCPRFDSYPVLIEP